MSSDSHSQHTPQSVEACPECESSAIYRRSPLRYGDAERFRCNDCGAVFPEPMERKPKKAGGNYSEAGKALRGADPDDLLTDGGRAESEKPTPHTVEFLTGSEVAQLDDDPVLERRDIWRGDHS